MKNDNILLIRLEKDRKELLYAIASINDQISQLHRVSDKIRTPWMQEVIGAHCDFLLNFTDKVNLIIQRYSQIIEHLKFQAGILEYWIEVYSKKNPEEFVTLIKKLIDDGKI